MRSRPGRAPTSSRYARAGGGAQYGDVGSGPAMASSSAALSRTLRVMTPGDREPVPDLRQVRTDRRPPARRLEAEQPAARGGDPDRAAAVVAVRRRHDARRDRRRRTAAGPARRALRIPRVVGRPVGLRLGDRQQPELGRAGLSDGDEASGAEPGDDRRVVVRLVRGQIAAAARGGRAGDLGVEDPSAGRGRRPVAPADRRRSRRGARRPPAGGRSRPGAGSPAARGRWRRRPARRA